jgi:hypothetical protein
MRTHRRTLVGFLLICASAILFAAASDGVALAAAPPCAELEFSGPIVVTPANPIAGNPATVEFHVKNSGKFKAPTQSPGTCNAGSFVAQFKLSPGGGAAVSEATSPPLEEGQTEALVLNYDFPKSGNFDTEVSINPAKEVAEKNYLNDIKLHTVTVSASKANPVITGVTVTSSDPTHAVVVNRPATAEIIVTNTGNVPSAPFYVQWTPNTFVKPLTQPVAGGLAPGESEPVFIEYTYTKTGSVNSTFTANAAGRLSPFSSVTKTFTVEAALANLRIAEVVEHPEFAGKPSSVEVTIENNGNAGAGPFLVEWKPGKGQTAQTVQVNELPEFGITTLTFINVFKTAGTYEGLITLDPKKAVKELFSTEKTAKTTFLIPEPTVDLTVTHISVSKPVVQAELATIVVTVKNLGNTESPSFVTAFNPNSPFGVSGSGSQTIAKETGPLGPGEEREIEYQFAYPKSGLYRTVAEVNFGKAVKETNTANNALLDEVTVEPAKIALEFSPDEIQMSLSEFFVKQKGTATVTVVNNGPIASGSFSVQFQQEEGGIKQSKTIPGLNPGESKTLTFSVSYSKATEGSPHTAKAIIDPTNQIVKTKSPDEVTKSGIEVLKKTAAIKLSVPEINVLGEPGNVASGKDPHFDKWRIYVFAYDPGQKCKVQSLSLAGEVITKTMNNLAPGAGGVCPNTGGPNPGEFFDPGSTVPTGALNAEVNLTEEQPLYVKTKATAYHEEKGKKSTTWATAQPGESLLNVPRAGKHGYLEGLASPMTVDGTGCHDTNGNEEGNEGDCYNVTYDLTLGSHHGPAVVRAGLRARAAAAAGGEGEEEPPELEVSEELSQAKAAVQAGVQAVEELNRRLEEEFLPVEEG